jgi:pimeloyl-ACP methyl ester carboxylesterase
VTPPPSRPSPRRERAALRLFRLFSPGLRRVPPIETPMELAPFEETLVVRHGRPGALGATVLPAGGACRGAILFLHPWLEWGAAYFHRRGRVPAARAAGFDTWLLDFSGFGRSASTARFYDRDVVDALDAMAERRPDMPLLVWGVSAGGYWAHVALSQRGGVAAAFFEDVAAHLFEWSWRERPLWRPAFVVFRTVFPDFYSWLDIRRHAPHLGVRAAAYVSGELDPGVTPEDTRTLAGAAGARHRILPGIGHLEAIKREPNQVIGLALDTFERGLFQRS